MKRLVVFSGAGMSAESGLTTFRDSGGLWEKYDIHEVATPEAWQANPELVLEFYNQRRTQVESAHPNEAHKALVELEHRYDVVVITQNIDDLHERAGTKNVIHLHGEIFKARGSNGADKLYPIRGPLRLGDVSEDGSQLRPHVVWFGEPVPEYDRARRIIGTADILLIIGTSLNVYPAAGLIFHAPSDIPMYLVDPAEVVNPGISNLIYLKEFATIAVPKVVGELMAEVQD